MHTKETDEANERELQDILSIVLSIEIWLNDKRCTNGKYLHRAAYVTKTHTHTMN